MNEKWIIKYLRNGKLIVIVMIMTLKDLAGIQWIEIFCGGRG